MSVHDLMTKPSKVTQAVTAINTPVQESSVVAPETVQAEPSLIETTEAAFGQYNIFAQAGRVLDRDFQPTELAWDYEGNKDELNKDIRPEFQGEMASASSLEHAQQIKSELIEEQDRLDTLSESGLTGTALSLGAMLLDPTVMAGGGAVIQASKAARISQAAIEGGVITAGVMSIEASANAEVDATDVMLYSLAGAGISGGFASVLGKSSQDVINRATQEATAHQAARHASSAETIHEYRHAMTETVEDIIAESADWADTNKIQRGGKVSETMDNLSAKFHGTLKTDSTNLWNAKSTVAQRFTHDMAESGSGIYGRTDTAAQIKDISERKYMTHFMPNYEGQAKAYGKEKGLKGHTAQAEGFNAALRKELEHMRRADIDGVQHTVTDNVAVAEAAQNWQKMMDDVINDAKSYGVAGFEEIKRVAGYVPLQWDGAKLRNLDGASYNRYKRLLTRGYESVGIPPETADKITDAVLDRTARKELRLDSNVSSLFSGDAAAELKTLLGAEDFEAVAAIVKGKQDDAGKSTHAKSRTDIDLTITDNAGFSLIDIVNNDMQFIGSKYAQEMAGRVSLASKGIKSEGDFSRIMEAALQQEAAKGGNVDLVRDSMQSVYNQLLSRPASGEGVHKGVRRFMDFAAVSMLGGMGMAQLAEYGPILAQLGMKDVMQNLKQMNPKNFKQQFEGELLQDMQSLMGKIGQEELLYSPFVRLEDKGDAVTNGMLKTYDDISARATQLNGYLSGNNQIKRHQQRMAVTIGAAKAVRLIKEGKHLDNKFFDEIGLNPKTVNEIQKRLESGDITFNGKSLDGLNLKGWSVEAGNNFAVAMNRHMHQVVQKSLAGENSYWMDGTLGAMMMQFRNYPVAAMGKQLGRSVRTGQFPQVAMYSAATATLAYNLKLTLQNKDTSSWTPEQHAMGAMSMASPAGLLPDMATLSMQMMGMEGQMRLGEYSNPVLSTGHALISSPLAVKNLATGEGTKGDISTLQTITPFSNILGMSALFNTAKQGM